MRGVVLAGGSEDALDPLSRLTHPHLLPAFDRPLLFHPLRSLRDADVREILILASGRHAEQPRRLLGDGRGFGFGGLRHQVVRPSRDEVRTLLLAERFARGGPICVVRGDQVIERNLQRVADLFRADPTGACVTLKKMSDARGQIVARFRSDRIVDLQESRGRRGAEVLTGIHFYDTTVFERIRMLPGAGDRNLADLARAYARTGDLRHQLLRGGWVGADSFDSLGRAGHLVARHGANKL